MHSPSALRSRRPYRPQLHYLEERLPLGDGVLGLLVGASLLSTDAPALAAVPVQASGKPGASVVGRIFNPSVWPDGLKIRPTAETFADAPHAALAAPDWAPLTNPFAPAAHRRHDTLATSPQSEPGPDIAPLPAPRAGEERGTARVFAAPAPHANAVLLATLVGMRTSDAPWAGAATLAQEAQVKENFGKLPLYFEQNVGQTDAQVHFFTRGPGYGLFLTSTEAVLVLSQPTAGRTGDVSPLVQDAVPDGMPHQGADAPRSPEKPPAIVRLQLVGGNAAPVVTGRDQLPGKVNYFLGNDPAQWHTNIATFARVKYDDVYPGIDLVYYGSQQQLEYDFVVSPGADPSVIRLNVSGAERLELDAASDLVVTAGGQELRQHKPFVYQMVGSARREVTSRFVLDGQQVRFAVGAYDASKPLVIDPVLGYSTFLGGSGNDYGRGIVMNPATGDTLVTGDTQSTNFPTANPFQPTFGGENDVFVTRIGSPPVAYYYVYPEGGQVAAGVPFDLYVFALDASFNIIPDYTGLILFWATDPLATTPIYYQYQRTDRGVAYFPGGLTFRTVGVQELYVFDWPGIQVFGYAAFDVRP